MKTIIRREFLEHIQSLQFLALLALTVILFAANGLIFVRSYQQQNDFYQKQVAMKENSPSTRVTYLFRRPNPLIFVAEGGNKDRPSGYSLHPKGALVAEPMNPRTFKLPDVLPLDWSFIIGILFSLYVILLSYNAISGEKEQGTLRLVLSNPLARVKLLAAKYFSLLFIVLVPLAVGALLSLIIVAALAPQILTLANVSRIFIAILLALAYVSLFIFLSLLVSALIPRSSLVLLTLLAAWILFAVIIPSSSIVLVEKLSAAPTEAQAAKMFEPMVQKEVWAKIKDIATKAERGEYKSEEEVKEAADRAFEEGQAKVVAFYENYDKAEKERTRAAKNLSRLSPAALLQYASEDIVQTGDEGEEQFLRQLREYSRVYDQYILKKVGKLVRTSNWSFGTEISLHGKTIEIHSPEPQEYQGDKSDFPKFSERRTPLAVSVKSALFDLSGLIVWNIILAGLAFSAFLRADVR